MVYDLANRTTTVANFDAAATGYVSRFDYRCDKAGNRTDTSSHETSGHGPSFRATPSRWFREGLCRKGSSGPGDSRSDHPNHEPAESLAGDPGRDSVIATSASRPGSPDRAPSTSGLGESGLVEAEKQLVISRGSVNPRCGIAAGEKPAIPAIVSLGSAKPGLNQLPLNGDDDGLGFQIPNAGGDEWFLRHSEEDCSRPLAA